ncbi:hypothetical protein ACF068_03820 [Streptomyces sp. NPDC016309]|uniref:hypothetical protein n=1 Tax=Streptomyces sp. NPDC016309 TaxID=3364965 RepID=UPI0036F58A0C
MSKSKRFVQQIASRRMPGAASGSDLDTVVRQIERITSVGALLAALEQLSRTGSKNNSDLLPWTIARVRFPFLDRPAGRVVSKAIAPPADQALPVVRLLAAARLLLGNPGRAERAALLALLAGTSAASTVRTGGLGMDGSDQLALINFVVAGLEKLSGSDSRARAACAHYLTAQSALSYLTSGLVKLASPTWRSGAAIPGVLRTRTYGDRNFYEYVKDRPELARLLAWAVIAGETLFPLLLVAPKPVARAGVAAGAVFHLANGRYMGLNRFLWSFTGTYPAVEYTRRELRARLGLGGS